jgi:hypothetical protein
VSGSDDDPHGETVSPNSHVPKSGELGETGDEQESSGSQSRQRLPLSPNTGPLRGRAHARAEDTEISIDPEIENIDSDLYGPDGTPWCRFGRDFTCLNGSRCLNPNHRRLGEEVEL